MHQNNIFLIFKKLFFIVAHQNDPKTLKNINFKQKQIFKNTSWTAFPNDPSSPKDY
jgi:hypothetical protein